MPDFNTKCQCQILGEGIGFLPDYMVREAMTQSLLVTRQIHNPAPGFAHVTGDSAFCYGSGDAVD
ncbi:LysR family transcriptional regulator [Escherichia coli]|uniref:LysR family transcriptional regulator n=1 Tax=Escherichia coli TaxID=562 RepID=A0A376U3C4_ECOLX|nr:LysR family transcriptional regulator [Escherichia coli]